MFRTINLDRWLVYTIAFLLITAGYLLAEIERYSIEIDSVYYPVFQSHKTR